MASMLLVSEALLRQFRLAKELRLKSRRASRQMPFGGGRSTEDAEKEVADDPQTGRMVGKASGIKASS